MLSARCVLLERGRLKRVRILRAAHRLDSVCHCMSSSAAASNSVSMYPWLKVCRLLDLRGQFRGHGLAGLVVLGKMIEHRRIAGPMLVELRGKLDEIARRRASRRGVGYVVLANMPCKAWPNSWNIVVTSSKLSSAGSPGGGLGEVGHVVNHRQRAQQLGLADQVVHPRAAVLVVALEVVAVPQRQRLAVRVEHLEHAHVRLVHGNVVALLEGDAVKLVAPRRTRRSPARCSARSRA